MVPRRDDLERLQRLLEARSRLETERELAAMLRAYDELAAEIQPLRKRVLDALARGDLEAAERLIHRLERTVIYWLRRRAPEERDAIMRMARRAAIRGAQAVDLAPLVAARPDANLSQYLTALEQLAAVGGVPFGGASIGAGYGRIAEVVQQQIARKVYGDGLNLSRRLHVRLAERAVEFNRILATGLREGRGAIEIAKQLQQLDVTDARIPQYLRRLEAAVRGTSDARIVDELRKAIPEMAKRKPGPLGMRGPARRVIQAARSGSAEKLDAALEYYLQRKVRYHAVVIARTEANAAFLAGEIERAKATPWVAGIKWHLSASHRRPCECEVLARQDLYGLGPGVYPPDRMPDIPHPSCHCFRTT